MTASNGALRTCGGDFLGTEFQIIGLFAVLLISKNRL
jgi:hypothetical protein